MLALKIPLAGLIYIVWWAIKQEPDEASSSDEDGGIRRHPRHPPNPFPRAPRRAPHGAPAPLPPPRVWTDRTLIRTVDRGPGSGTHCRKDAAPSARLAVYH